MVDITRVWIEEGCIACGACPTVCPAVFDIPDQDAEIRGEARIDGITSPNLEKSRLNALGMLYTSEIEEAAYGCPVEVIKYDAHSDA